jgi:Trk-type K+ transport system membrane component
VISPAQLFIYSFLIIIIIGALLLMLPSATHYGISFTDALFTSTSAVCVTGLTVVETGSYFTGTGQFTILLLIQIGGIGIMTFASYFSFFFRGVSSYENQLVIKEITNTDKLGEVFSILKKIILVTFLIEGMGAFLIYHSVGQGVISDTSERVFFSIFHSVSGFCNAGFSTLNNSFSGGPFQFNYPFLLIISALIVVGGLGFPIVFNLLKYISVKTLNLLKMVFTGRRPKIIPWIININTRIILITTLILIASGMVLFFIFEYNNTLSGHNFLGKLTISVFSSVTSRTAGFSSVEIPSLGISATLIIALLMWIGASPGSTGGGIKTSTFAIAILNIFTIARGKSRLELFKREISTTTVNRAFAIIILSVLIIFTSVFLITLFDPDLGLFNIVFECISAYSTTGLSRGITPDLSAVSKFVLIVTMFIGRVSMLTILIALFKKSEHGIYRYPSENILIN